PHCLGQLPPHPLERASPHLTRCTRPSLTCVACDGAVLTWCPRAWCVQWIGFAIAGFSHMMKVSPRAPAAVDVVDSLLSFGVCIINFAGLACLWAEAFRQDAPGITGLSGICLVLLMAFLWAAFVQRGLAICLIVEFAAVGLQNGLMQSALLGRGSSTDD